MIDLGDIQIQQSESVRSQGVVIDNTLSFDAHVNPVFKAANYHAKALRHIRKRVTTDVAVSRCRYGYRDVCGNSFSDMK